MNKHPVTICGLRVVTTCCSNRTSPSEWVGLGTLLAACSVYGDPTCSVRTVNNSCMFNCQCHFYLCNRGPYVRLAFMPNMLSSWNKDIIIIIIKWLIWSGSALFAFVPFKGTLGASRVVFRYAVVQTKRLLTLFTKACPVYDENMELPFERNETNNAAFLSETGCANCRWWNYDSVCTNSLTKYGWLIYQIVV